MKDGRVRRIRLYRAWLAMRSRVSGSKLAPNGKSYWKGLPIDFDDWPHFRAWSLANGFSHQCNSLDRIDSAGGYSPENCRWVSVSENSLAAAIKANLGQRT